MNTEVLERLISILESTSLVEIELSADGEEFYLKKVNQTGATVAIAKANATATQDQQTESALPSVTSNTATITSGLTGTFYRAQSPDAQPFVNVGDWVEEGQSIGIIEAMKMLNVIEADTAGRIAAIRAEDGATIKSGSVLFEIETSGVTNV